MTEALVPDVKAKYQFVGAADLPQADEIDRPAPSKNFIESVRARQIHPIVLIEHADRYEIVAGRSRVLACHYGDMTGLWALVYQPGEINASLIAVAENHHRSPNPVSDYHAISHLLETASIEQVAASLNLPLKVVVAAHRLSHLCPELLEAVLSSEIAVGVGVAIAAKPQRVQQRIVEAMHAGERITGKAAARIAGDAAMESVAALGFEVPVADTPNIRFISAVAFADDKVKVTLWENGVNRTAVLPEKYLINLCRGELA